MSSSAGTARQNKFVLIYIVELSKPYRMVFESWESVQAKQIVPLFTRVYFSACAKCMPLNSCHGAHGRLRVINQTLLNSKRVLLSVSLR